jgi:hypothetical protein
MKIAKKYVSGDSKQALNGVCTVCNYDGESSSEEGQNA